MKRIVVIGIGNEFRGDDAIGLEVARGLKKLNIVNVSIQESTGDCSELMNIWNGVDSAIAIDAMSPMGSPGAVHSFDATIAPIPDGVFRTDSTHSMGIAEAIELSRTLNRLPAKLIVFGIEGKDFSVGIGLSQEVAAALERALMQIRQSVQSFFPTTSKSSQSNESAL